MKYMGSKARIAKHIFPIMDFFAKERGYTIWVEPFVGGGNMIDKVPERYSRHGFDLNPHVIQALTDIRDYPELLPDTVTESDYASMRGTAPSPFTSWIRFVCAFAGIFESGFARQGPDPRYKSTPNEEGKRNALKQSPKIQNVRLEVSSYDEIDISGAVIYCDPPLSRNYRVQNWRIRSR